MLRLSALGFCEKVATEYTKKISVRQCLFTDFGIQEKFAFTKPGSQYGSNVTVQALLADGTSREWSISDPSQRYD